MDKPPGMTSFDVVRAVRKLAKTRKVGHTGTLDPDATGLLAVAIGGCTKLTRFLLLDEKRYAYTVKFGAATTTDDSTGEVLREAPVEHLTEAVIRAGMEGFLGEIEQVPPVYSAIKVRGKRAHKLARAGEDVEMKARMVWIKELELKSFRRDAWEADFEVWCGSGTYVRSLARDLGEEVGSAAHTTAIRRLSVGLFLLEEAVVLGELTEENLGEHLRTPLQMVQSLGTVEVDEAQAQALRMGQPIEAEAPEGEFLAAHRGDELVAVVYWRGEGDDRRLWPRRVMT